MDKRAFDLSDVLSITTGYLVSRRHMEGVYDILNFMTGDNLFTHALPRASRICAPILMEQHPALASVDAELPRLQSMLAEAGPDGASAACDAWVDSLVPSLGRTLDIEPIKPGEYQSRDPIGELVEMMGKAKD